MISRCRRLDASLSASVARAWNRMLKKFRARASAVSTRSPSSWPKTLTIRPPLGCRAALPELSLPILPDFGVGYTCDTTPRCSPITTDGFRDLADHGDVHPESD